MHAAEEVFDPNEESLLAELHLATSGRNVPGEGLGGGGGGGEYIHDWSLCACAAYVLLLCGGPSDLISGERHLVYSVSLEHH